ncbi:MAG: hypothetical protein AAF514_06210, partial [Verrucomicrobiota bacterium]
MKAVFWILFLGLVLAAGFLRRQNQRLQSEVDAYRELIQTSGSPTPEQLPFGSPVPKSESDPAARPLNHASVVEAALADKRQADLERGLFAWAQSDPTSALQWFAEKIGDPFQHSGLMDHPDAHLHGAVLAGIASNDAAAALHLFGREKPRHPAAAALFPAAGRFLHPARFDRLMEEALKIDDASIRFAALQIGIGTMNRAGRFDSAADFALRPANLPPTERNQLIMTAATYHKDGATGPDPGKTADWLAEASDQEYAPQNMAFFLQRWAGSHFDQAAEWLNGVESALLAWLTKPATAWSRHSADSTPLS